MPGPDIDLNAAAALGGATYAATRTVLRALERGSLIQQHALGRYRLHDLVRAFAREQAEACLDEEQRTSALRRLTDFYLHTLIVADSVANQGRPSTVPTSTPVGFAPVALRDRRDAMEWFRREAENITAIQRLAEDFQWHEQAWQFASQGNYFYAETRSQQERLAMLTDGLIAAEAVDDQDGIARIHRMIAQATTRIGNHDQALDNIRTALRISEERGNLIDRILNLLSLSEINSRMGRHDEAGSAGMLAWELSGDQTSVFRARIANDVAYRLALGGRYAEARAMADTSMRLAEEANMPDVFRGYTLETLGRICYETGELDQAVVYLEDAVARLADVPYSLADTLVTLSRTYDSLDRVDLAISFLERALELYEQQYRKADAQHTREALDELTHKGAAVHGGLAPVVK